MSTIIGFEGPWPDDEPVAWGAAVIEDRGLLRNSFSWLQVPASEIERHKREGSIVLLPRPFDEEAKDPRGSVVLGVRKDFFFADQISPSRNLEAGVLALRWTKDLRFVLFSDRASFDSYASDTANRIFLNVARNETRGDSVLKLINCGLTLAQSNPYLLAWKASLGSGSEPRKALLRKRCRNAKDAEVFDDVLLALSSDSSIYGIKYRDGIAEYGGLDVGVASKQLKALDSIQPEMCQEVAESLPFQVKSSDFPKLHLRALKAASATLELDAVGRYNVPLERYLQLLQIRRLKEVIDGQLSPEMRSDTSFLENLSRLLRPDEDTTVEHSRLGDEVFTAVGYSPIEVKEYVPGEALTCLGFVQGVYSKLTKIEIRITSNGAIKMAARNDGEGGQPKGSGILLNSNDFLFRPMRFRVRRHRGPNGEIKIWLHEMQLIGGDAVDIECLASDVVQGSVVKLPTRVQIEDGSLRIEYLTTGATGIYSISTTKDGAESWLEGVLSASRSLELQLPDDTEESSWLRVGKRSRPSPGQVYLNALQALGGKARLSTWRSELGDILAAPPSFSRLESEARRMKEFVVEEKGTWTLTPLGWRYLSVLSQAT